jgi:hypothetical protein
MSFIAVIDISTFIWCEQDFNLNKKQYIILKSLLSELFTQIKGQKLPILFRDNLQQLIWAEFPYKLLNEKEIGYDFLKLTYEFLLDTFHKWEIYLENIDDNVFCSPVLIKQHFSNSIKAETQSQVCHFFYNKQNPEHKYLVYNYFFNQDGNLRINGKDESIEVDTLQYESENEIIQFFDKYKIKFDHNSKHRSYCYRDDRGEIVSPFSCYHIQGASEAQNLLDTSIQYDGHYYNFDKINRVFVRFIKTNDLTYHGHDISDEGNNVPNKIKKTFLTNGRTFQP